MNQALKKRDERVALYEEKERENNYELTEFIAQNRNASMTQVLNTGRKLMQAIDELANEETVDADGNRRKKNLSMKNIGSICRAFEVTANTINKTVLIDHAPKPKAEETQQVKVGLFVQCAPLRVSEKPAIDVEISE